MSSDHYLRYLDAPDRPPTPQELPLTAPAPSANGHVAIIPVGEDPAHLTDRGNAIRLAKAHRDVLRYCWPWKKWLVWDGARWRVDDTADVTRRAKLVLVEQFAGAVAEIKAIEKALENLVEDDADAQ